MRLSERLKQLRSARGLSLRALSEMTGIDIKNLSQIESGKNSPTLNTTEKICKALGVHIIIIDEQNNTKNADTQ